MRYKICLHQQSDEPQWWRLCCCVLSCSRPVCPGERVCPLQHCSSAQRPKSSRAADGEPGGDGRGHGPQHVPAVHRLGVQPRLAGRRRVLSVLRPHGHDLQHLQHHDAGGDGDDQVPGSRKSTQERWGFYYLFLLLLWIYKPEFCILSNQSCLNTLHSL